MSVRSLIREEFEKWLNAIDDNKVVGIPRDSQRCPLALYLQEVSGGETYLVYRSYYSLYVSGNLPIETPLPKWAYSFALGIDKIFDEVPKLLEVTVAQCKEVLAKIPRSEDENESRVA